MIVPIGLNVILMKRREEMSIKIWEAYRIPKSKLIEFTDMLHDAMFESVVQYCKALMGAVKPDVLEKTVRDDEVLFIPKDADLSKPKMNGLCDS